MTEHDKKFTYLQKKKKIENFCYRPILHTFWTKKRKWTLLTADIKIHRWNKWLNNLLNINWYLISVQPICTLWFMENHHRKFSVSWQTFSKSWLSRFSPVSNVKWNTKKLRVFNFENLTKSTQKMAITVSNYQFDDDILIWTLSFAESDSDVVIKMITCNVLAWIQTLNGIKPDSLVHL